ncbi:CBS domain-containing protein [Kitasatospora sp. P5_F3]
MNRSILDGTPTPAFADPGAGAPLGRSPVREWMSRPAVAVTPGTDFAAMVAAITASRRGVLPVVSGKQVPVGVVAASDLLAAYATEEQSRHSPAEITARDLMTSPAVTVTEDETIAEAARTARREAVHHLPVVDAEGRLSGIVSPHDLLDALRADDEALRTVVLTMALTPGSGVVPSSLHVRCERGHVVLAGHTRSRTDAAALCLQVARIDGLNGLTDRLRWDVDDTDPHGGAALEDELR